MIKPFFITFKWNKYFLEEIRCKLWRHNHLASWLKLNGYDTGTCVKCGRTVEAEDLLATQLKRANT